MWYYSQDIGWCEHVRFRIPMDEPCQHTQSWNEGDNLEEAPEAEEESEDHCVERLGEHESLVYGCISVCDGKLMM